MKSRASHFRLAIVLLVMVATVLVTSLASGEVSRAAGPVTLQPGIGYSRGWSWQDPTGRYTLAFQSDGNLVLYEDEHPHALWDSHTWGTDAHWLVMQGDGNLVLYNNSGTARWHTNTWGNPGSYGSLQWDGNLVLYRPNGSWTWNAGTWQLPAWNQEAYMRDIVLTKSYSWWKGVVATGSSYITSYEYLSIFPWLNWTNDSCSAPLLGDSAWNFSSACKRHDFGYRNLQRAQRDFPASTFWSGRNRNAVDSNFHGDMLDRCNEWNVGVRPLCIVDANLYYGAVQAFGGPFSTSGYGATTFTY